MCGWMIWSGFLMREEMMLMGFSMQMRSIGAAMSLRTNSSASS